MNLMRWVEENRMSIDWNRDWKLAPISDLLDALDALANGLGGEEAAVIEAAIEQLWRLRQLEK